MADIRLLQNQLDRHLPTDEDEHHSLILIREFLLRSQAPFSRENVEGHITASAIIVDPATRHVILLFHPKLARWLQPGGHIEDTDDGVFSAALREGIEETGIPRLEAPWGDKILDLDVHGIPARSDTPAHVHYDIRFLFVFGLNSLACTLPAGVRWFHSEELQTLSLDPALSRAIRKGRMLIGPEFRAANPLRENPNG